MIYKGVFSGVYRFGIETEDEKNKYSQYIDPASFPELKSESPSPDVIRDFIKKGIKLKGNDVFVLPHALTTDMFRDQNVYEEIMNNGESGVIVKKTETDDIYFSFLKGVEGDRFFCFNLELTDDNAWEERINLTKKIKQYISSGTFYIGPGEKDTGKSYALRTLLNYEEALTLFNNKFRSNMKLPFVKLTPYQRRGVLDLYGNFKKGLKGVGLFDQMGLGKTIQGIITLEMCNYYPALVVAPPIGRGVWEREINKWLNNKSIITCWDKKKFLKVLDEIKKGNEQIPEYMIVPYSLLKKLVSPLIDSNISFKSIIFDESQKIKNYSAARTRAALQLCSFYSSAKKICITGTPYQRSVYELLPQLQASGLLGTYFDGKKAFIDNFVKIEEKNIYLKGGKIRTIKLFETKFSALPQLQRKLTGCSIRRYKKDVLPQLPVKIYKRIDIDPHDLDKEVMNAYREAEKLVADSYRELTKKKFSGFYDKEKREKMSKQEIEDNMEEVNKSVENVQKNNIFSLRHALSSAKINPAIEYVEDLFEGSEPGTKIVVFCYHRDVVEKITEHFGNIAVKVYGGMKAKDKDDAIEQFQTNPKITLAVVSIPTAGEAITLTAASHGVFVEFPYTYADMTQVEDRLHRLGQKNAVEYHNLVISNTVDDKVLYKIIERGRAEVEGLSDDVEVKEMFDEFISSLTKPKKTKKKTESKLKTKPKKTKKKTKKKTEIKTEIEKKKPIETTDIIDNSLSLNFDTNFDTSEDTEDTEQMSL